MICAGCASSIPSDQDHQVCMANNCRRHFHNGCVCGQHGSQFMRPVSGTPRQVLRPQSNTQQVNRPSTVNPTNLPSPIIPPTVTAIPTSHTGARTIGIISAFLVVTCLIVVTVIFIANNSPSSNPPTYNGSNTNYENPVNPSSNLQNTPVYSNEQTPHPTNTPRTSPTNVRPTNTTKVNSCPGAPQQRLKVNEDAEVCTKKDWVFLRKSPSRSSTVIVHLDPGTIVWVLGGPECADDWSWWQVKAPNGQIGWMSEGGDSTDSYFLCPN